MNLSQFFEQIYRPHRLRGRSENTLRLYRYSVRSYSAWLARPAALADLTDDSVAAYLASLADRELSPYSVAKERAQLVAIWNFAARRRLVDQFPNVTAERVPKRVPEAWTAAEVHRILTSCQGESGTIEGVPAAAWWLALHCIIWDTAERISAVLKIRFRDVRDGWLVVPAEHRKGCREDKIFRLSPATLAQLEQIRRPPRPLVLPWPFTVATLYRRYGRILRRANLPADGRSKFHKMRRTVASYYCAAGGDATQLLGHTRAETTAAYLDPRILQPPQPADVLPQLEVK